MGHLLRFLSWFPGRLPLNIGLRCGLEGLLRAPGELGEDEGVGLAKECGDLGGAEAAVVGVDLHPVGAGKIGGGDDARKFRQFVKGFLRTFKGVAVGRLGVHADIHFAGDFEQEVAAPLDLLGGARE